MNRVILYLTDKELDWIQNLVDYDFTYNKSRNTPISEDTLRRVCDDLEVEKVVDEE